MSDHLVIITGASSGIGAALAHHALTAGARVATMSRRPGPGRHVAVDLGDPSLWPTAVEWINARVREAAEDGIDRVSFVHNAGTLEPIGFAGEVDTTAYQAAVLLNSGSGQVLGSGFLSVMDSVGLDGLLVMMRSGAGKRPIPGWSGYCAAKSALDMWVRVVGMERAERTAGVVVASVAPGVVDTPMQAEIRSQSSHTFPDVEQFQSLHADGALASADDVGRMFWELCRRTNLVQGVVASITELV
jgi:NAD(P)-dependent dehydrogenase (short-subunit alcohol dehydrogenase family)